jgi:hypothetical protein
MNPLESPTLLAIRQNHAIEHATVHILQRRYPYIRLIGRSTPSGFWLVGELETQDVADAVSEGLARLQGGEHALAVHPRCGTNIAAAGVVTGIAALIAQGRRGSRLEALPRVILATTLALVAAQPLGTLLQQYVLTESDVEGVTVAGVLRQQVGNWVAHRIEITRD